jgi:hypothetical protein
MKKRTVSLLAGCGLTIFFAAAWFVGAHDSRSNNDVLGAEKIPVLVELFTSEGCSSCPDADALLARLDTQQPVSGADVIVLEQHVDYWDGQGWPDPFASRAATKRQEDYAAFLHSEVYTPQMIVDGRTEFVGSSAITARNAILTAAGIPKAAIHVEWAGDAASNSRVLRVRVGRLPAGASGGNAEVFLAVTESHLHSDVQRGENAGRGLEHDGVVRELARIGKADANGEASFDAQPAVKSSPGWKRENLRVVVFVQDSRSRRVLGAASLKY